VLVRLHFVLDNTAHNTLNFMNLISGQYLFNILMLYMESKSNNIHLRNWLLQTLFVYNMKYVSLLRLKALNATFSNLIQIYM
jgi:hypothetical protein